MPKPLGELLKKARQDAKLSLSDVARLTDMPTGQLSMMETGVRPNPGFLTVAKLAKGLKISLDALASQCAFEEGGEVKVALEPSEREYLTMLREIEAAIDGNEKIAARLRSLLEKKGAPAKKSTKGKRPS